jgi:DNA-nicking Smr family endonuclease
MRNGVAPTIDLHGMNHLEAVTACEDFLLELSVTPYFDATVITGNSNKLQNKIIENVLDKYNFNYYIPTWNQGQIIVSQ